ncbi:MAG TPA: DUF5678 domain-containing protein [Candidatus Saccharimonadia bacterium]|nr:DUF5678 domain-containing protein [Candidatus Saccharimonadia bacterium]
MAARDWSKLYQKYRGQWVALKDDHMTAIVSGDSRADVKAKAAQLGYTKPFVVKMPDDLMLFAG